jgi:hypothetical protein
VYIYTANYNNLWRESMLGITLNFITLFKWTILLRKHINIHILISSWKWALLEKPLVAQLFKNFPAFYGTQRFITVFTRALHWSLSWARSIQSIPPNPIYLRSILILSTHLHLGLPGGLSPAGFPTIILYAFLFTPSVLHVLPIWSLFTWLF